MLTRCEKAAAGRAGSGEEREEIGESTVFLNPLQLFLPDPTRPAPAFSISSSLTESLEQATEQTTVKLSIISVHCHQLIKKLCFQVTERSISFMYRCWKFNNQ